ncbi:MAG: histidinol-phosphatase HisJ family protein [Acholeplasmataceae bacterium]|nr:histidinol-phosphatase HisJ family protein [Acholeplasmataceae bacterium]
MNKKIIDHHMHTNYSLDADPKATFKTYVDKAKTLGIERLIFTDHVDFDSPAEIFDTPIDYDLYIKDLNETAKNEQFQLSLGVELGYQPHLKERNKALTEAYPFEFVISSIHFCDGLDLYNGDFFKGKTQKEAYQRYFEICLEAAENYDGYDVFGHLDYIIRYGGYQNRRYNYTDHEETIEKILAAIIKNSKGMEINTSGIRYGLGMVHPTLEIMKAYKRLGGKIVTIGSDAHYTKDYYSGFDEALQLLKDAGFDEVTVFEQRKPKFIKI